MTTGGTLTHIPLPSSCLASSLQTPLLLPSLSPEEKIDKKILNKSSLKADTTSSHLSYSNSSYSWYAISFNI